jgi:hypothetical protein
MLKRFARPGIYTAIKYEKKGLLLSRLFVYSFVLGVVELCKWVMGYIEVLTTLVG